MSKTGKPEGSLLSVGEYAQLLAGAARELLASQPSAGGEHNVEVVPLSQARGRVLAKPLEALVAVPPFDNSAMDGFALRVADFGAAAAQQDTSPAPGIVASSEASRPHNRPSAARPVAALPVSLDIPAGQAAPALPAGTCARVMTGAMIPPGADAVVMVEDTDVPAGPQPLPARVTFFRAPRVGQNIRHAGEGATAGSPLLPAGRALDAKAIAALAATGHAQVPVVPQVRVSILVSGDELVAPGTQLRGAQIHDSNSVLLAGLLEEAGAQVVRIVRAGDDPQAFGPALEEAKTGAEVVISTGGVSAGAFDVVKQVLSAQGGQFHKVAMQPGKPQGFGLLPAAPNSNSRVVMLALPGNPVSVFVSFHVFVRPVLDLLAAGGTAPAASTALTRAGMTGTKVWARTAQDWSFKTGRDKFVPVALAFDTGQENTSPDLLPVASNLHSQIIGSHLINTLRLCDGLALVDKQVSALPAGSHVQVLLT